MPYYDILRLAEKNPALDLTPYVAQAPAEHRPEFSYTSELVTHDGAIASLLSLDTALARMQQDLGLDTSGQRQWLHDELVRIWKVRGPYPGLGAILRAFGLTRGLFVGHHLQHLAGENVDPWPMVDAVFNNPEDILPRELQRDIHELAPTWRGLSSERRAVLRLLSRFELNLEQAEILYEERSRNKQGWAVSDHDLLANPYRIYECGRQDPAGVQLLTIDRGVFPDDTVRLLHPLDEPSSCDSPVDARRVRAFTIQALEEAADSGHTLHFTDSLVDTIRTQPVRPECPVTSDILRATAVSMAPDVITITNHGQTAFQLDRYRVFRELANRQIIGRVNGQRHHITHDWLALLEAKFGSAKDDQDELRAREEKAAALAEMAQSRFSILAGPAGAGKTSVLGILCGQPEIKDQGLLLLAPTGKARVRMQHLADGVATKAYTLAQFLNANGRYDGRSGRYHVSNTHPQVSGYGTVIIDEASMLTEDMLGALLDTLKGVSRLILVGDRAQLPPIGAGRPFVDIITKLRPTNFEAQFPRIAPGYAELTIERRQIGNKRPDIQFARWFGASEPSVADDDIFSAGDTEHDTIRFVRWDTADEFQAKLLEVLTTELNLAGSDDERGFNASLGATQSGSYDYFNATRNESKGAVQAIENWQILTPLRGSPIGVEDVNRQIHKRFRAGFLKLATQQQYSRPIPKPMGAEQIVYGDKVINLSNHRRNNAYPSQDALNYLANGEIGVAVGQWKTKAYPNPKTLKIEFSSQEGYAYSFSGSDFQEEGSATLELAYALTVHKSQGSQFELVILVLPEQHPLISRELVYTALTRHKGRVVVMHQGERSRLKELTMLHHSEIARRRTNLLVECQMVEFRLAKGSLFLQEGLIHRTSNGIAMRSKSELLIAEAFLSAKVGFEYEKPLVLGGETRYPDFTIEDDVSGRTIYWEHLGMLDRDTYRASWQKKLAWYRANGVYPIDEAPLGATLLVTTEDSPTQGLDMVRVKALIAEVCGG